MSKRTHVKQETAKAAKDANAAYAMFRIIRRNGITIRNIAEFRAFLTAVISKRNRKRDWEEKL